MSKMVCPDICILRVCVCRWDVIKHGQMGVDWDPTFLMLVLPSSLRFFAICAMVGDTEDSKVPTVPYPSPSSSEGPSEDRMFRGPFGRIPNDLLEPYVSDDALVRLQGACFL